MESVETDFGLSRVLSVSLAGGSEALLPSCTIETAVAERTARFASPVQLTPVEDLALAVVPKPAPQTALETEIVLSPTQARTFLGCSARWWFKYGLSLPEPKTSSLAFGLAMHRALELNFRQKLETREDLETGGMVT